MCWVVNQFVERLKMPNRYIHGHNATSCRIDVCLVTYGWYMVDLPVFLGFWWIIAFSVFGVLFERFSK
jgi:hypothetical protein